MSALFVALLTACAALPVALAAQQDTAQYATKVWAGVLFSRTGERTPEVLGYIPTTLTTLGAQQVSNSGAFFRKRYVPSASSTQGGNISPLQGLSANSIDPRQLYVAALDQQFCLASAQAFVQGLYPPFTLNSSISSTTGPASILANGVQGYQYAQIHSAGALDPEFPYLGGSLDCPGFNVAATGYTNTAEFAVTQAASKAVYEAIGPPLLSDVLVKGAWDYSNAYAIYDYVNYLNSYNRTAAALLSQAQYKDPRTYISYLDSLRYYADQLQYAQLGNLTTPDKYSANGTRLPGGVRGSISTIAGNLLAAKMLSQLQVAIKTQGEYYKLSVLFGDFEPLMSLFALAGLPKWNSNFRSLPEFGSVAVLELFSYTNDSINILFPKPADLWVRFSFRNGTGDSNNLQAYPIFNRDPDRTDMSWSDFQTAMLGISLGDIGSWCAACGAENLFCAAWNSSDAVSGSAADPMVSDKHKGLKPAVAGFIGAVVALAIAGLIFAAAVTIGGLRCYRARRSQKSDLGGFKGSMKLASDKDLSIPKGGAVVGATVEHVSPESPMGPSGQERVGSWELRHAEGDRPRSMNIADAHSMRRPGSFEDEERVDHYRQPVRPDERV